MDGNAAMGEFVATYLAQPPDKRFYLEMAMNHARFGSILAPFHLHDILDHLIRGLECLCREHKLVQQNLGSALSSKTRASVQAIVNEARLGLQKLADNSATSSALDEHRMVTVIKSRAENWHTTENNFGLSVVALLQKFGFCDADVIDKYLAANPRPDKIPDWASVLAAYRNATIHEGYLDFKHDANDVVRVCLHLKDALTRVILRECGYTGTYTPVLRRSYGPQPLDWIQPTTPASHLGF